MPSGLWAHRPSQDAKDELILAGQALRSDPSFQYIQARLGAPDPADEVLADVCTFGFAWKQIFTVGSSVSWGISTHCWGRSTVTLDSGRHSSRLELSDTGIRFVRQPTTVNRTGDSGGTPDRQVKRGTQECPAVTP